MSDHHGIGWAVKQMQDGQQVRRAGWNGKGMYIKLMIPTQDISRPYVIMWTAQKHWQPGWLCSQADLLARDWEIAT